jgi:hypothetical protein
MENISREDVIVSPDLDAAKNSKEAEALQQRLRKTTGGIVLQTLNKRQLTAIRRCPFSATEAGFPEYFLSHSRAGFFLLPSGNLAKKWRVVSCSPSHCCPT